MVCEEIPDPHDKGQGIAALSGTCEKGPERFPRILVTLTMPLMARAMTVHGGRLDERSQHPWRLELCWPLSAP